MNKKKYTKDLKTTIDFLSQRICILRSKADTCEQSNRVYNRLLIERACARKKLKELQSKNVIPMIFKKFQPKKPKLICDYFNSK